MRLPIAVRDDGFSWLYAITPPCTPEKLRRKCVTYLDGIAEIRERAYLDLCFENLRHSRYAKDKTGEYNLYYIMK